MTNSLPAQQGRHIIVNAVTVDEAAQTAVLTTDETWAVADQE